VAGQENHLLTVGEFRPDQFVLAVQGVRAMMPVERGLENSVSADFFTVPLFVAMKTNWPASSRVARATSAVSFHLPGISPGWKSLAASGRPAASGSSYTFSQ